MPTALDEFEEDGADRAGVAVDELPVGFPVVARAQFAQLGNGLCVNPEAAGGRRGNGSGLRCVSRVYTDHTIFDIDSPGARPVRVLELLPSRCPHWKSGFRVGLIPQSSVIAHRMPPTRTRPANRIAVASTGGR